MTSTLRYRENMNTRQFIHEIRNRKALWNPSNQYYHNKTVIHELWREVATIFNVEVQTAKQKWKNLRDTFRVELKKIKKCKEGDNPDALNRAVWVHYEDMLFIKDILKTRKLRDLLEPSVSNDENWKEAVKIEHDITFSPTRISENVDENSMTKDENTSFDTLIPSADTTNYSSKRGVKRKSYDEESSSENVDDEQDDDLLFFRSLLPFVKKLDQDKKLLFRMNVHQMLYNHLYNNN